MNIHLRHVKVFPAKRPDATGDLDMFSLLDGIAQITTESKEFSDAMERFLRTICENLGWVIGDAYLWSKEEGTLIPMDVWYVRDGVEAFAFKEATNKARFKKGIGLPGRVLETGKPTWIEDVARDDNFPRAPHAFSAGVKAGMAFPVVVGTDVVAVTEFFASEAGPPPKEIQKSLVYLGAQLGRVFEREKNQRFLESMIGEFQDKVSHIVENLAGIAQETLADAKSMVSGSRDALASVGSVEQFCQNVSNNIGDVAAATEEMNTSVSGLNSNMTTIGDIVKDAALRTRNIDEEATKLADGAKQIDAINNLITEISGQTHLLALNATIEAARAGDAGKGFNVVAGEVKSLATRTAGASQEISGTIGAALEQVQQVVSAIEKIETTIERTNTGMEEISHTVSQQAAAIHEVSQSTAQVSNDTTELFGRAQNLNQSVQDLDSSASRVLERNTALADSVELLNSELDRFMAKLRTT